MSVSPSVIKLILWNPYFFVPFVFEDFDFTVLCFCCSGEHTYSMTRFTRSSLTCVLLVCFFAKKRDLFYFTRVLFFWHFWPYENEQKLNKKSYTLLFFDQKSNFWSSGFFTCINFDQKRGPFCSSHGAFRSTTCPSRRFFGPKIEK